MNCKKIVSVILVCIMSTSVLTSCVKKNQYTQEKQNSGLQEQMNMKTGDTKPENTNTEMQKDKSGVKSAENSQNASGNTGLKDQEQAGNTKRVPKSPKAKAVYITGWTAGNPAQIQKIVNLAKATEVNAVVLDIKDDDGKVGYETGLKDVRDIGAWEKKYDVDKVIKTFHENNIYVIGRLVCFKDPILAEKRKDLAFKTKDGGVWRDWNKRAWVNPFNKDTWEYFLSIAKEAVDKGFDEIQFDYVRFSNDGDIRTIDFGQNFDSNTKSDVIAEFLKKSKKVIHDEKGVILSADVFGIAAVGTADDKILGQNWEKLSREVDYLCPMVYPSHYANVRQNGMGQDINGVLFKKPDLEPHNVILQTLLSGKKRLESAEIKTGIRPYLQAFNAPWLGEGYWQKYGAQQIKEQIKAVYDAGYDEWILWDPNNSYPEAYFEKKK